MSFWAAPHQVHGTGLKRGISDLAGLGLEKPLVPGGDMSVSSEQPDHKLLKPMKL